MTEIIDWMSKLLASSFFQLTSRGSSSALWSFAVAWTIDDDFVSNF